MSSKTIGINNVNQTTGEVTVLVRVAEGQNYLAGSARVDVSAQFSPFEPGGTAPAFNPNNYVIDDPQLSGQFPNIYYFGKDGNSFYIIGNGAVTAVTGTDEISGVPPYFELMQIESGLSTAWGSNRFSGQLLLDNTNAAKSNYNLADQSVMKCAANDVVCIKTNEGSIAASSAYMWPLSRNEISRRARITTKISGGWLRESVTDNSQYKKTHVQSATLGDISSYDGSRSFPVHPCFNLDLAKLLLFKTSTKDTTSESVTYIGTKIMEDSKFLVNTGSIKASNFSINRNGQYTGASTTSINGGINYISEIIYDSAGKSLYYGNLGVVSASSGIAPLVKPDNIASGNYIVAVFEEEKCDSYKMDYACTPVYFTLSVA